MPATVDEDNDDGYFIVREEISSPNKHTGYKISSINLNRKWTTRVVNHIRNFPKGSLVVVDCIKNGYELIDVYKC